MVWKYGDPRTALAAFSISECFTAEVPHGALAAAGRSRSAPSVTESGRPEFVLVSTLSGSPQADNNATVAAITHPNDFVFTEAITAPSRACHVIDVMLFVESPHEIVHAKIG